ncbi:UV radiation resistance-associated protein [Wickerhamomyces ciferrii]|uniref:Autophagy-related protein 14 n=1 Tax=Wickerhamomyces ciferrii (strain ATCC 14091 / BCRC 22168 / CBS 111 / JCM 3599 / NBRC 0793 / NRRL Y-1031 F-60-10) TaxID=1206466 RepID=K0KL29_WICCF|nr:UV radiation resistance-associated protein [Wickerhamomyces ciferrii]CCH41798.1 UV radiation resistance-associated protein [Wickerhamomyces ciferrii]
MSSTLNVNVENYLNEHANERHHHRRSSTTTTTTPTKHRRDTKDQIIGFETPLDRQLHLQKLNSSKFLNCFISLHYLTQGNQGDQCFYVSELKERSINIDFQEFNVENLKNSNNQSFKLKIWISNYDSPKNWKLLMDLDINLSNLLYINNSIDLIHYDFKNSVFISLFDGIYLLPNENFNLMEYLNNVKSTKIPKPSLYSFNYDLVMKLNNLQLVIDDLSKVKKQLSQKISLKLENTQILESFKLDQLKTKLAKQKEVNNIKRQKLNELLNIKEKKLQFLNKQNLNKLSTFQKFNSIKEEFSSLLIQNETITQDLIIERSRKIKTISSIFPLGDISEWLKIPNFQTLPDQLTQSHLTQLLNTNDFNTIAQINSSFGYLVHIIYLLSHYLAIPLKYQIYSFDFNMVLCY